ncbi:SigE family RNA polymerase sigma factor [Nocardioides exalbidus]|uniref:SigE family RNA polymerase sigma factor n=1 Tax=Nocardioides exalbidus TaxID=402596 RepID=UPI000AFFBD63|nr:SigE family RNA polymerase sigma factor [Nocardioides exalbidus]
MRKAEREAAYVICGDWDRADDLLQQALVKLYVAWPRVRRDGREEAYVRQILLRAHIDEHRRPWRREQATDRLPERAAREPFPVEERTVLMQALEQLSAMQRACVVSRHWLGLSVAETATDLGIPEGTVKSHTSRGLAALQGMLEPDRRA